MTHPEKTLRAIRRPRLLVKAARLGAGSARAESDVGRLFPQFDTADRRELFDALAMREAELDGERRAGEVTYSAAQHIRMLSGMILLARLMRPATA